MRHLVFAFSLSLGCAAGPRPGASSAEPNAPPAQQTANEPSNGAESGSSPAIENAPQVPPEPPPGVPMLPAVTLRSVGLHVGGGPHDAAGKAPFLTAIEQRFPDFLRCYRFVDEPGKSGTFGVDLHLARGGGRPRIEQPRTALTGDEFRACMLSAFESIEFSGIEKPTVVSYSLRFSVGP